MQITGEIIRENFAPWLLGLAPDSPCLERDGASLKGSLIIFHEDAISAIEAAGAKRFRLVINASLILRREPGMAKPTTLVFPARATERS
jgi:hypothetical protein